MKVLAFDQSSSTTGYAVGDSRQDVRGYLVSSFKTPKSEVFGERLATIFRELSALIEQHKPDLVAFESPYFPVDTQRFRKGGMSLPLGGEDIPVDDRGSAFSVDVIKKLQQVAGCVMTVAALYSVPVESYASSSWRVTFLGYGRAPKGGEKDHMKKAAIRKAQQLGYKVKGHDEADALGLLVHALRGPQAAARAQGDLLQMASKGL